MRYNGGKLNEVTTHVFSPHAPIHFPISPHIAAALVNVSLLVNVLQVLSVLFLVLLQNRAALHVPKVLSNPLLVPPRA